MFFELHNIEGKRALEMRGGNIEGDGINISLFKVGLAYQMGKIGKILREHDPNLSLKTEGENPFPVLFIFSHECNFINKYGEKNTGIDAMATIPLNELRKIQPGTLGTNGFNEDCVHMVARIEVTDKFPIDLKSLTYEEAITPGIIKKGRQKREIMPSDLRSQLLVEANYACQECGARMEDGATLEIDHIVPFSKGGTDDYVNLQILCATCNRKKSASL